MGWADARLVWTVRRAPQLFAGTEFGTQSQQDLGSVAVADDTPGHASAGAGPQPVVRHIASA
jgi:hypothetical protein